MKERKNLQQTVAQLKAVSEETRVRILFALDGQPLCLDHLTRIFSQVPSTLSAHLRVLTGAGLVEMTREGHWHYFHLPRHEENSDASGLQDWLWRQAGDDPRVKADLERRLVALGESEAPVPEFMKANILFLCTGNSCRSQMAEALLRAKTEARFNVYSAGLEPKPIPELTAEVMKEVGIDLDGQEPKNVLRYLGHLNFEYLITVCESAESRCPVFPGVRKRLCWALPDPAAATGTRAKRLQHFRQVRDELSAKIDAWLAELDEKRKR